MKVGSVRLIHRHLAPSPTRQSELDHFGGGTIPQGSLPGGSLAAWWEEVKAWIGQVTGGGKVAAPAALERRPAALQSDLAVNDPPQARYTAVITSWARYGWP